MATTRLRRTFKYPSASDGEMSDDGRDEMDEEGESVCLLLWRACGFCQIAPTNTYSYTHVGGSGAGIQESGRQRRRSKHREE